MRERDESCYVYSDISHIRIYSYTIYDYDEDEDEDDDDDDDDDDDIFIRLYLGYFEGRNDTNENHGVSEP